MDSSAGVFDRELYEGPPITCGVCGKDMTPKYEGDVYWGVQLQVYDESTEDEGWVQRQVGAYTIGKPYRACWECFLRVFGFTP